MNAELDFTPWLELGRQSVASNDDAGIWRAMLGIQDAVDTWREGLS